MKHLILDYSGCGIGFICHASLVDLIMAPYLEALSCQVVVGQMRHLLPFIDLVAA